MFLNSLVSRKIGNKKEFPSASYENRKRGNVMIFLKMNILDYHITK